MKGFILSVTIYCQFVRFQKYGLGRADSTRPGPLNFKPGPARFLLSKFLFLLSKFWPGPGPRASRSVQGSYIRQCRYVTLLTRCTHTLIPWSHSYCLSLPLCLEWCNGSITPRVHSGVTKRIECGYTTDRPRPLNKCVKPLSGVGQVRLTITYPTPDSCLAYIICTLSVLQYCSRRYQ